MVEQQLKLALKLLRDGWRHRRLALAVAAIVYALTCLGIYAIPDRFEAGAQIYVDTKTMLKPLLEGLAVSANTDTQANVVQRSLLSRPTLEAVARETGLISRARTPRDQDLLLAALAKRVAVTGDIRSNIYTIRYTDPQANMAFGVVKSLLDSFVKSSVGEGRADAENAEKFLVEQVSQYAARLTEAEQRLAEFKKQNMGLMPDDRGDYFAKLQQENALVEKLSTDLAVITGQQAALRSKISTDGTSTAPTSGQIQLATVLDAQIARGRSDLEALLLKYTEKHPQVVAKREEIQRLEERRRTEAGGVTATVASFQTNGTGGDTVVQNLQIGLNNADVQAASLRAQLGQAQKRVADLRRLVNVGPEVEAQLAQLNRDYGVTKVRYEALVQRLESARISDKADRSGEMKFRVLDPPRIPERPSAPLRSVLLVVAFILSCLAGIGSGVGLAQVRSAIFNKDDLAAVVSVPVLGVISYARTPADDARRTASRNAFLLGVAVFVVSVLISIVFASPLSKTVQQLLGMTAS